MLQKGRQEWGKSGNFSDQVSAHFCCYVLDLKSPGFVPFVAIPSDLGSRSDIHGMKMIKSVSLLGVAEQVVNISCIHCIS